MVQVYTTYIFLTHYPKQTFLFSGLTCISHVPQASKTNSFQNFYGLDIASSRYYILIAQLCPNLKTRIWDSMLHQQSMPLQYHLSNEPHHEKTCLRGFVIRLDSNWPAQLQRPLKSLEILDLTNLDIILQ